MTLSRYERRVLARLDESLSNGPHRLAGETGPDWRSTIYTLILFPFVATLLLAPSNLNILMTLSGAVLALSLAAILKFRKKRRSDLRSRRSQFSSWFSNSCRYADPLVWF
jgi:hypothetical protein